MVRSQVLSDTETETEIDTHIDKLALNPMGICVVVRLCAV